MISRSAGLRIVMRPLLRVAVLPLTLHPLQLQFKTQLLCSAEALLVIGLSVLIAEVVLIIRAMFCAGIWNALLTK